MKTIAFGLILLSLGIMHISGSLLCTEVLGIPLGCATVCTTFPYECTSDGICICTAKDALNVTIECDANNPITSAACNTICVPVGSLATSNCDGGICHCVYDL